MSQLGGIKLHEFINGAFKGIRAADIKTSSGTDLTVLIDRGMDISSLFTKVFRFLLNLLQKKHNQFTMKATV